MTPLLELRAVSKAFGPVRAVEAVSLVVGEGETLAVVGESGSGKSTLGRLALRLLAPDAGEVWFEGEDLARLAPRALRRRRRSMQMVFQDPVSSLNPRCRLEEIVTEPLRLHPPADLPRGRGRRGWLRDRAGECLHRVGLNPAWRRRYPHELSGGQRQRLAIARALACGPRLIVADEPLASLDTVAAAQIVELFRELQKSFGIAYLLISHDLASVAQLAHRVAVMHCGQIVECGPRRQIFRHPTHVYTQELIAAALRATRPQRGGHLPELPRF